MQVRQGASGCLALQSNLAAKALEHIDSSGEEGFSLMSKDPSELLGSAHVLGPGNASIRLPSSSGNVYLA